MKTLLVGLIGAGIQRSLAPALQEEEARHHGLRLHYQLIDLDSVAAGVEVLPALIAAARVMGFAGLNVTYPCKQSVIPLLDELSDEARAIGAVNTVVREGDRLVGYNTDASGWSWGFRRALPRRICRAWCCSVPAAPARPAATRCSPRRRRTPDRRRRPLARHPARGALHLYFPDRRSAAGTRIGAALRERPHPRYPGRHGKRCGHAAR